MCQTILILLRVKIYNPEISSKVNNNEDYYISCNSVSNNNNLRDLPRLVIIQ